jgi:hypothetical protein
MSVSMNYSCISVQEHPGFTYLYPDQKFRLAAAPPCAGTINPNILFVDENDQLKPGRPGCNGTW